MKGLKGKTAIVTGGSRGIGKAIAAMLLENEVSVLITGRKKETGIEAIEELRKKYEAPIHFFQGNMEEEKVCIDTADEAMKLFGRVDYLVNNAFPFTAKYIDATRRDWLHVMEAGPIAYATMITQYVRVHGEKVPGAIVNLSSISEYIAQPQRWTYNAAKGAVGQLTRCAAMDLAPYIRVNRVSPASVFTDECTVDRDDPIFKRTHMIDRAIESEEVAPAVLFLLSDYASAITASDIYVDAGYLAMRAGDWHYTSPNKGSY
jgi:NAD(P)-dependent dehydrogenase (short-subunit alcohol dehydrogenase family)